jgi:hypothetical protein
MRKPIHPLIHQAIDAAFCVIQEAYDPINRFDAGGQADHYSEKFQTFDAIAEALAHYSEWEAARVKTARASAAEVQVTPAMAASIVSLLENPAAYALVGWEEAMEDERPAEFKAWEDKLNAALAALGSKHTFETLRRFNG